MEITELIDAAAKAAVEHVELPPHVAELLAGRRQDGTYALTDYAFGVYFPEEDRAANLANRRNAQTEGRNPDDYTGSASLAQMRESAFRQVNYALLTSGGVPPVTARETINAAIERGNI
ncbi:hypothetical protein [Manganibacter manganicus]|uniref:hypothetical protein n=1 Tax=Manganibacter manganicus TaxID=1873176 RepID=UPI0009BB342B|nr:hypothetical protein [Pseudaminobacter manganicus]